MIKSSEPANQDRSRVAALVLCGGEGRRMGGGEKGLRLLGGKPLLDHVVRRLAPQVAVLSLCCNRAIDQYRGVFDGAIIGDTPALEGTGPLAGMIAGLAFYQEVNQVKFGTGARTLDTDTLHSAFRVHYLPSVLLKPHNEKASACSLPFEWLMVVPCDAPLIPHNLVDRLLQAATPKNDIMVAADAEHVHYTHVLLRMHVLPRFLEYRQQHQRLKHLYEMFNVGTVRFEHSMEFANINTHDALNELEAYYSRTQNDVESNA